MITRETAIRGIRFLTVGGTAAVVQLTLMRILGPRLPVNLAFVLAFLGSTTTHYILNRFWALPSARHDVWRQFREYLGAVALSLVINLVVFRLVRDYFGLGNLWATAIAIPPSTVVVFLLLNFRVFRARNGARS